ncbi:hypothetical protein [Tropicibacter naphthalenivorans]|uniref:Uncharacterized protein n=1 Tax=Tropicibacter naphthalenivorans TaxID=441103 RepID=A0A0P1GKW2_9RHOB|nr:hypothetical protein [Tropicibacter naphthalenivorans]CUH82368.1 hypothetical protein TRN7648_03933 [Tropicibacter naphthalenivorans]SMD05386.1 hypothetical protein SAMN04488093_1133 [Tropicibacter naphthalenivorans]
MRSKTHPDRAPFAVRFAMAIASTLFLALPYFWYALYVDRMSAFEPVRELTELAVTIPATANPEDAHIIGLVELGQSPGSDSADGRHAAISGPPAAASIANISSRRLMALRYENESFNNLEFPLSAGDQFTLSGVTYQVDIPPDGRSLRLMHAGASVVTLPQVYGLHQLGLSAWESNSLSIGGRVPHAPDQLDQAGSLETLKRLGLLWLKRAPAPDITVPQDNVAEGSLRIFKSDRSTGYKLRTQRGRLVSVCPASGPDCFQLGAQPWPIDDPARLGKLNSVILGRTEYSVTQVAGQLFFNPVNRGHWLTQEDLNRDGLDPAETYAKRQFSPTFMRGLPSVQAPNLFAAIGYLFDALSYKAIGLLLLLGVYAWLQNPKLPIPTVFVTLAFTLWFLAVSPAVTRRLGVENADYLLFGLGIGYMLLPLLKFVFSLRTLRLIKQPKSWPRLMWNRVRSQDKVRLLLWMIVGLLVLWLLQNPDPNPVPPSLFAAHSALIALFAVAFLALAYALVMNAAGGAFLFLFWVSVTVVAGLGAVALAQQTLGNHFALNVRLYERHLSALAMIAFLAVIMAVIPPRRIVDVSKRTLRIGFMGHRIPRWILALGAAFLAVCALLFIVIRAGLTTISLPQWLTTLPQDWRGWLLPAAGILILLVLSLLIVKRTSRITEWFKAAQRLPSVILLGPSVILAGLVFVTPETGIGGVQPSEAAKTWLAILLGLFLAIWLERREWMLSFERGRSVALLLLYFALVAVFFAVGSAINFDMSPILIILAMSVLSGGCVTIFLVLNGKPLILRGLILLLLALGLTYLGVPLYVTAALSLVLLWFTGIQQQQMRKHHRVPALATVRAPWYRGQATQERTAVSDLFIWANSKSQAFYVIAFLTVFGIFAGGWQLGQILPRAFDTNTLRTLQVNPLPAVPQERILSFMDASLYRAPDPDTDLLIIEHPDLSLQVRQSRQVIAATDCGFWQEIKSTAPETPISLDPLVTPRLQEAFTGLCPSYSTLFPIKGDVPESVLRVPAIQDDFAITFLLASFGLDVVPVMIAAQALMLTSMLALAMNAGLRMSVYPSFRGVGLFCTVAVGNLAVILWCQFAMSWLNMLGLSAVVGQPMTFVSLGASHHLAFALPAVSLTVMAGLMSNPDALQPREERQLHSLSLRRHWGPIQGR